MSTMIMATMLVVVIIGFNRADVPARCPQRGRSVFLQLDTVSIEPTFPPDVHDKAMTTVVLALICFNRADVPARCPHVCIWRRRRRVTVSIEPTFPPDVHNRLSFCLGILNHMSFNRADVPARCPHYKNVFIKKYRGKFHIWIPPLKQAVC